MWSLLMSYICGFSFIEMKSIKIIGQCRWILSENKNIDLNMED